MGGWVFFLAVKTGLFSFLRCSGMRVNPSKRPFFFLASISLVPLCNYVREGKTQFTIARLFRGGNFFPSPIASGVLWSALIDEVSHYEKCIGTLSALKISGPMQFGCIFEKLHQRYRVLLNEIEPCKMLKCSASKFFFFFTPDLFFINFSLFLFSHMISADSLSICKRFGGKKCRSRFSSSSPSFQFSMWIKMRFWIAEQGQ